MAAIACKAVVCSLIAVPGALANAGSTILVLGDSISAGYGIQREQGWVERLQERLDGHDNGWTVVNASVSGETTGGGLARLPDALASHRPDLVILELGGNDGLRGYPIARIRGNLDRMVRLVQEAGAVALVVGMQIPPNYGPRYTQAFAGVFTEVAERHGAPLVPFLLERVALQPQLMQSDGIHPTADAQPLLLDTVWPHLAPLLETAAVSAPDPGQSAVTSG
ncbi:MAG: arylesterase [Pseudomonadales bacterium]